MKKDILNFLFYCFAFLFFCVSTCFAQVKGTAQTFMEKEVVYWDYHSTIVNDDYTIYVHVPPGYDSTKIKYPVLYVTDGDWDENSAINSFNMLRQDYITREAIIVAIGYGERPNQRNRDFEPATGGPHFLAFIEKELIPFIESKYRATDDRTLSGYSYGGRFAFYVLFNRPGLFNTICIGAPGSSFDLVPSAQKYFATHKDLKARVFLSVGAYELERVRDISLFKAYLLAQNCKDLEVETGIVPNAAHGAAKPKVIQDGIEFAFCKKHKPIIVPFDTLAKYAGKYVSTSDTTQKFKMYVENGKLYFSDGGDLSQQFVPFAKDKFFVYGDEKSEMLFKEEGSKMYELYIPYLGSPFSFVRTQ